MSIVAEAMAGLVPPELFAIKARESKLGISDIMRSVQGAGFYVGYDALEIAVSLTYGEPSVVAKALAHDADRFSGAGFQSLRSIVPEILDKESAGWAFVKIYYSAFYCSHAILRLCGESCTWVDATTANGIKKLLRAQGVLEPLILSRGLYHVIAKTDREVVVKLLGTADGGTHETFWKVFSRFLDAAAEESLRSPLVGNESHRVFELLQTLRSCLSHQNSACGWLSRVRNEIQYKHGKGLWRHGSASSSTREALARRASQWSSDPLSIDMNCMHDELSAFVAICMLTVSICRDVLQRICDRASTPRSSFTRSLLELCT